MMIVMHHVLKFAYARFGSHTVAERSGTVSTVIVGCTRERTGDGTGDCIERFVMTAAPSFVWSRSCGQHARRWWYVSLVAGEEAEALCPVP